jgi:phosphoglycerate dehydrogenase-like enzyme
MKLVIHPPVDEHRLVQIRAAAGAMRVVNADDSRVLAEMADADAFFGKLTPLLLRAAHNLQWVQSPTASLEHYLFPELVEHPCLLSNMRGLFSDVIADHVMGFVICFARNLHTYILQQAQGVWNAVGGEAGRSNFVSGPGTCSSVDASHRHLADGVLGVVGAGAIGSEIARRGHAFGMRIVAVDPLTKSLPGLCDVWPTERLPDLLAESDYVVIAAPHTPQTEKLFRLPQFQQMKRTAVLINIGRGAIVDLHDLTTALQSETIGGAGLDVFETEPLPGDHPLWKMPNVIITPHIAGTSPRISERHTATLLENIRRFVAGKPPATLVDKRRWF